MTASTTVRALAVLLAAAPLAPALVSCHPADPPPLRPPSPTNPSNAFAVPRGLRSSALLLAPDTRADMGVHAR